MKKIDDEKIVKLVKNDTNYQIKTTSQSILNQYAYEKNLDSQINKSHKKRKILIAFSSIFGSLAIAGAAVSGIILFTNNNKNINPDVINPITPKPNPEINTVLKKQLVTFSAFTTINDAKTLNLHSLKRANLLSDEEENEDGPIVQEDLKELIGKSIDAYEKIEESVNYLYHENNVKIETTNVKATFDGTDYSLVSKFYYGESSKPFALYYFNEPQEELENSTSISKAYYECNNLRFNIDVKEEKEVENDESEVETTLILRDVDKFDKHVYVVKKEVENEIEDGKNSNENELSIISYLNEESFKEDEYLSKIKAETEVEDNENKIEVSYKSNEIKVSYNINKIDETTLNLLTDYEEKTGEERSFEQELINLKYKDNSRIYSWNESTWTFN